MLFLRYHPLLLHYGIRLCHDEDLAEECIQDLFCYLYEKRKNLIQINHIKGYLFAAFRYRIMRKRQRENQAFSIDSFPENSWGFQAPVEDLLIQRELDSFRQQQLLSFLEELSQRQREVIFLKYYNGLDAAEITQVMGISHQGVLNMLYKALKNLRRLARSSNVADPS